MIISICDVPDVLKVMRIVNIVITIIKIVVPIMLIVSAMIDFARAVSDGELNKITKPMINKVIAAILVFLIPTFVKLIANIADNDGEYTNCLGNISQEQINTAYNNEEETLISKAESTNELSDYNNANNYLTNIKDSSKREEFLNRLKSVKEKIDANKKETESTKNTSLAGSVSGEKGTYTFSGSGTDNILINTLGDEFITVKTKASLLDYVNFIHNRGIYQAYNKEKYNDKCLGFSYTHAWGLYTNNRTYTGDSGASYAGATHFTGYIDSNKNVIMNIIYNEILNGRPMVIQVNGNKAGTSRHFVAVVGFKSSVKSGNSLTEKDLLIIDSWDGKLERMDTSTSRFMTTGEACHKTYKGYYVFFIKQSSQLQPSASTETHTHYNTSSGNKSNGTTSNNESIHTTSGSYGCTMDDLDTAWYNCFKKSHNLVVPSLGAQGSTITMKVGETKSFNVNIPSECGTLVKWTRTSADGSSGWNNYVTQGRTNINNNGFIWTVTAKKTGSVTVSQTVQYDSKSPSGKCTKNVKSMYRFNIKITN